MSWRAPPSCPRAWHGLVNRPGRPVLSAGYAGPGAPGGGQGRGAPPSGRGSGGVGRGGGRGGGSGGSSFGGGGRGGFGGMGGFGDSTGPGAGRGRGASPRSEADSGGRARDFFADLVEKEEKQARAMQDVAKSRPASLPELGGPGSGFGGGGRRSLDPFLSRASAAHQENMVQTRERDKLLAEAFARSTPTSGGRGRGSAAGASAQGRSMRPAEPASSRTLPPRGFPERRQSPQGQGQFQSQSQGQFQGQMRGQSQGQFQGQSQGQFQRQFQGRPPLNQGPAQGQGQGRGQGRGGGVVAPRYPPSRLDAQRSHSPRAGSPRQFPQQDMESGARRPDRRRANDDENVDEDEEEENEDDIVTPDMEAAEEFASGGGDWEQEDPREVKRHLKQLKAESKRAGRKKDHRRRDFDEYEIEEPRAKRRGGRGGRDFGEEGFTARRDNEDFDEFGGRDEDDDEAFSSSRKKGRRMEEEEEEEEEEYENDDGEEEEEDEMAPGRGGERESPEERAVRIQQLRAHLLETLERVRMERAEGSAEDGDPEAPVPRSQRRRFGRDPEGLEGMGPRVAPRVIGGPESRGPQGREGVEGARGVSDELKFMRGIGYDPQIPESVEGHKARKYLFEGEDGLDHEGTEPIPLLGLHPSGIPPQVRVEPFMRDELILTHMRAVEEDDEDGDVEYSRVKKDEFLNLMSNNEEFENWVEPINEIEDEMVNELKEDIDMPVNLSDEELGESMARIRNLTSYVTEEAEKKGMTPTAYIEEELFRISRDEALLPEEGESDWDRKVVLTDSLSPTTSLSFFADGERGVRHVATEMDAVQEWVEKRQKRLDHLSARSSIYWRTVHRLHSQKAPSANVEKKRSLNALFARAPPVVKSDPYSSLRA